MRSESKLNEWYEGLVTDYEDMLNDLYNKKVVECKRYLNRHLAFFLNKRVYSKEYKMFGELSIFLNNFHDRYPVAIGFFPYVGKKKDKLYDKPYDFRVIENEKDVFLFLKAYDFTKEG